MLPGLCSSCQNVLLPRSHLVSTCAAFTPGIVHAAGRLRKGIEETRVRGTQLGLGLEENKEVK